MGRRACPIPGSKLLLDAPWQRSDRWGAIGGLELLRAERQTGAPSWAFG